MKSYLKFLSRNKAYTFINIAGLVVSLMFIILMGDYTWRQYSIDSWHKNADRIYLMSEESFFFLWPQAADGIRQQCPDVEQTCCVLSQSGHIKHEDKEVKDRENGIIMLADSTFFRFFDFPLVKGNRQTALDAPDKCVVTESLARRLFGDKNPIGETVQIVGDRHIYYRTGQGGLWSLGTEGRPRQWYHCRRLLPERIRPAPVEHHCRGKRVPLGR